MLVVVNGIVLVRKDLSDGVKSHVALEVHNDLKYSCYGQYKTGRRNSNCLFGSKHEAENAESPKDPS